MSLSKPSFIKVIFTNAIPAFFSVMFICTFCVYVYFLMFVPNDEWAPELHLSMAGILLLFSAIILLSYWIIVRGFKGCIECHGKLTSIIYPVPLGGAAYEYEYIYEGNIYKSRSLLYGPGSNLDELNVGDNIKVLVSPGNMYAYIKDAYYS